MIPLIVVILVLITSISVQASQPAPPPAEIEGMIEPIFAEFKEMAARDPQRFGFSDKAALEQATIEEGYPVYIIDEAALKGFKGNIYQLEQYAQAWDFVIYDRENKPQTYLEMEYDENEARYYLGGYGGDPSILARANQALRAFAGDEGKNVHFVKVAGERLLIFEYDYQGQPAPYAIPLTDSLSEQAKPLDYKQTIEYLKKLKGYDYDEKQRTEVSESLPSTPSMSTYIWIALFVALMLAGVRFTNGRLRKERESDASRLDSPAKRRFIKKDE
jgi:hypothetical protein